MISSRPENEALAHANARAAAGQLQQYLTFALGSESYAAAIDSIREILEVPPLTVVPLVPEFVRGVINLRGSVVPVIDLSSRFELGRTQIARRTCVVVIETGGESAEDGRDPDGPGERQILGVMVDAVHEVVEIAAGQVEPTPMMGTCIHPDFIRGMAKVNGRHLVVLSLGKALAQARLAALVESHLAA